MKSIGPVRLRLGEFAKWIGETPPSLRGHLVRKTAPFKPAMPDGSQRTYSGEDLLAWCLFTQLRRVGLSVEVASETVRLSHAAQTYLGALRQDEIDETMASAKLHLVLNVVRRDRGAPLGMIEPPGYFVGDPADIAALLTQEVEQYEQKNPWSGYINLGLVSLVTVPIFPCYERCRKTAEARGFRLQYGDLFEIQAKI